MIPAVKKWMFRPGMADGFAGSADEAGGGFFGGPLKVRGDLPAPGNSRPGSVLAGTFRTVRSRMPGAVLGRLRECISLQRRTVSAFTGTILRSLGIVDEEDIVFPDPHTAVVTTRESVTRIPFDRTSEARCRLNARVLAALETTPVAGFVPRPLGIGKACGLSCYRESRLRGSACSGSRKEMQSLFPAAAEFITAFHLLTAREVVIDDRRFHRLFARDLRRLDGHLAGPGRAKRASLERILRKRFLYAPCKTVWSHGDCAMEHLLFDPSSRRVCGVTGWGFARRNGLPLLDIFSLLIQAKSRCTRRTVDEEFRERCFIGRWDNEEGTIVDRYVSLLHLPREYVRPLLVMFWARHTARRLGQQRPAAVPEEVRNDIESTLEAALDVLGGPHGR